MAVFDMSNAMGRGFNMSGSAAPSWRFFDASYTGTVEFSVEAGNLLFWNVFGHSKITEYNVEVTRSPGVTRVDEVFYQDADQAYFTIKAIGQNVSEQDLRSGSWFSQLLRGADRFEATDFRDVIYSGAGNDEIFGYAGDDNLYGEEGGDTLYGGNGNDVLVGGAGMDTLYGGNGDDTYYIEGDEVYSDDGGIDTYMVNESFNIRAPVPDIENLVFIGAGNFVGEGNSLNNKIAGGVGADTLDGASGDDTLTGGDGGDTLDGSFGSDTLTGGNGNDHLNGGAGRDLLDGGAGGDRMEGGSDDDIYIVDSALDVVIGDAGSNDLVRTTLNSYTLPANVAALEFSGTGSFFARGGSGANAIMGGTGNDRLNGMDGNDTLTGGTGADVFAFSTKAGRANTDRVLDFFVPQDSIWLDNAVFKKLGKKGSEARPAKLNKDAFFIGTKAKDAEDRIIYNKKTGALLYDADGSGSGAAVQFATLTKNLKLTAADFFVI